MSTKTRRQLAGENKSLPRLPAPFSPFRRRAPHLDGCAGVSPTEVLKGNREALPRRVQVVLNYLKVEGKISGELWPDGWGAAILFLPICSLFLCVPNLGSHKSEETLSHPTPPTPNSRGSHLRSVCQVPFPITLAEELQEWIRFPQEVLSIPQRPVIRLGRNNHCARPLYPA